MRAHAIWVYKRGSRWSVNRPTARGKRGYELEFDTWAAAYCYAEYVGRAARSAA